MNCLKFKEIKRGGTTSEAAQKDAARTKDCSEATIVLEFLAPSPAELQEKRSGALKEMSKRSTNYGSIRR